MAISSKSKKWLKDETWTNLEKVIRQQSPTRHLDWRQKSDKEYAGLVQMEKARKSMIQNCPGGSQLEQLVCRLMGTNGIVPCSQSLSAAWSLLEQLKILSKGQVKPEWTLGLRTKQKTTCGIQVVYGVYPKRKWHSGYGKGDVNAPAVAICHAILDFLWRHGATLALMDTLPPDTKPTTTILD